MNLDYTESFEQFANRLSTTDIALYAGLGIVLWVMFKDKLSPVQVLLSSVFTKVKNLVPQNVKPLLPTQSSTQLAKQDMFFELITSWKQTRDLAVACGCKEAVDACDQMFSSLSPAVCGKDVV